MMHMCTFNVILIKLEIRIIATIEGSHECSTDVAVRKSKGVTKFMGCYLRTTFLCSY